MEEIYIVSRTLEMDLGQLVQRMRGTPTASSIPIRRACGVPEQFGASNLRFRAASRIGKRATGRDLHAGHPA